MTKTGKLQNEDRNCNHHKHKTETQHKARKQKKKEKSQGISTCVTKCNKTSWNQEQF